MYHFQHFIQQSLYVQKKTIMMILKTRMTTFIKTKFKRSDNQTNIDNYRVAVYYRISHDIKISLP